MNNYLSEYKKYKQKYLYLKRFKNPINIIGGSLDEQIDNLNKICNKDIEIALKDNGNRDLFFNNNIPFQIEPKIVLKTTPSMAVFIGEYQGKEVVVKAEKITKELLPETLHYLNVKKHQNEKGYSCNFFLDIKRFFISNNLTFHSDKDMNPYYTEDQENQIIKNTNFRRDDTTKLYSYKFIEIADGDIGNIFLNGFKHNFNNDKHIESLQLLLGILWQIIYAYKYIHHNIGLIHSDFHLGNIFYIKDNTSNDKFEFVMGDKLYSYNKKLVDNVVIKFADYGSYSVTRYIQECYRDKSLNYDEYNPYSDLSILLKSILKNGYFRSSLYYLHNTHHPSYNAFKLVLQNIFINDNIYQEFIRNLESNEEYDLRFKLKSIDSYDGILKLDDIQNRYNIIYKLSYQKNEKIFELIYNKEITNLLNMEIKNISDDNTVFNCFQ